MATAILHHVTLQTGHWRESPRAEVRDDVIRTLAPLLARVVRGEEVAVPGMEPSCTMTGAGGGDVAILTVWGPPEGEQPVPLATMGLAAGPAEADRLWAMLHSSYEGMMGLELLTPPDQAPPLPWCGARLEVGLALHPEAAAWLGDLERCLAWTWIERRGRTPAELRPPRIPRARPRPPPSGPVRRGPRRR